MHITITWHNYTISLLTTNANKYIILGQLSSCATHMVPITACILSRLAAFLKLLLADHPNHILCQRHGMHLSQASCQKP